MVHFTVALTAYFLTSALAAQSIPSRDVIERDIVARALNERQYPSGDGNPGASQADGGSNETVVQVVTVSDASGALMYFPESITAQPGSIVQFQFYPKNHTITESTFAEPCKPFANSSSATRPGQKSGFVPVSPDAQFRPVYNLLVNDTKPIWIYCGQTGHCAKGMAMVINQAPGQTEKTLENYKKAAAALAAGSSSMSGYGSTTTAAGAATQAPSAANSYTMSASAATSASGPSISAGASSSPTGPGTFGGDAARPEIARWMGMAGLAVAGLVALL